MLKIVIVINDLIEKAKLKAYLGIANNMQDYYHFEISAKFNNSDKAVDFLYENEDVDILILESGVSGTFSAIDLILLAEKKFPKINSILICDNGDELDLAEHKISNLSAVLNKSTTSDTFINSLFMTAVKQQQLKEDIEKEKNKLKDYREIIDYTHDAIFLLDVDEDNNVYYRRINKTYQQRTSLSSKQISAKTSVEIYGEELGAKFGEKYLQCIKEKRRLKYREKISFKTGDIVAETSLYPIVEDGKVKNIIGASLDITEHHKMEKELQHQKTHDNLTNLYNKEFFIEKLNKLNKNSELPISIILLELDSYSVYKRKYGDKKAEDLLDRIVKVINYNTSRDSFIARIGESRFAVILQSKKSKKRSDFKELTDEVSKMTFDSLKFDFSAQLFEIKEKEEDIINYYDYINEKLNLKTFDHKFSSNSVFYNSLIKKIYKSSCSSVQARNSLLKLTKETAAYFELGDQQKEELILLAELHDIGKISLDPKILKKGKILSEKEWSAYLRYVEKSAALTAEYYDLSNIYKLIYHQHENYDGSGYPAGLKEKEIPYLIRLFRIIVFYDILRSNSFYPFLKNTYYFAKFEEKEIISELEKHKGIVFDPEITDKFIDMAKKY